MYRLTRLAATLALGASISLPALAEEARYNQVALRAEVSQEVAHDLMHVSLYSEAQNSDPAALAEACAAAAASGTATPVISVAAAARGIRNLLIVKNLSRQQRARTTCSSLQIRFDNPIATRHAARMAPVNRG